MPPLVPLEGEDLEALAVVLGEDDDLVASLDHGLDAHVVALALVLPILVAEDLGGLEEAVVADGDRLAVASLGDRVAADAADDGLRALLAVLDEALEKQGSFAGREDDGEHGVARRVVDLLDRGDFSHLLGLESLVEGFDGLFKGGQRQGNDCGIHSVNPYVVINGEC